MTLRIGSLFSGIGGLELGLERATGGRTVFQVELDDFCCAVLAKHWPDAERFSDVCEVGAHNLPACDVLCGGFPCQDISVAGLGAGLAGERSGLWFEFARIVRELRPRIVVVENVAALLVRGLDAVLGSLAACGYDALWDCVPAAAVGAPHRRDRLFIVAWRRDGVGDSERVGRRGLTIGAARNDGNRTATGRTEGADRAEHASPTLADARDDGCARVATRDGADGGVEVEPRHDADGRGATVADADDAGPQGHGRPVELVGEAGRRGARRHGAAGRPGDDGRHRPAEPRMGRSAHGLSAGLDGAFARAVAAAREAPYEWPAGEWPTPCAGNPNDGEPVESWFARADRLKAKGMNGNGAGVPLSIAVRADGMWPARPGQPQHAWEPPRTARGVPNRAARLRALGNAVVPQVAEAIGRVVLDVLAHLDSHREAA